VADEPLLEIIEDLLPTDLYARACEVCRSKAWYFGHGSHEADSLHF